MFHSTPAISRAVFNYWKTRFTCKRGGGRKHGDLEGEWTLGKRDSRKTRGSLAQNCFRFIAPLRRKKKEERRKKKEEIRNKKEERRKKERKKEEKVRREQRREGGKRAEEDKKT